MPISFDDAKCAHDFDCGRVNFYAEDNGSRVYCAVSDEALQDFTHNTSASPDVLVQLYQDNSAAIHAVAAAKYRNRAFEADGYIYVKSADLC